MFKYMFKKLYKIFFIIYSISKGKIVREYISISNCMINFRTVTCLRFVD